MLTILDRWFNS